MKREHAIAPGEAHHRRDIFRPQIRQREVRGFLPPAKIKLVRPRFLFNGIHSIGHVNPAMLDLDGLWQPFVIANRASNCVLTSHDLTMTDFFGNVKTLFEYYGQRMTS